MAGKRVRQFCSACNQITTQVKERDQPWRCLCCESAKFRSEAAPKNVKKPQKKRLNLSF